MARMTLEQMEAMQEKLAQAIKEYKQEEKTKKQKNGHVCFTFGRKHKGKEEYQISTSAKEFGVLKYMAFVKGKENAEIVVRALTKFYLWNKNREVNVPVRVAVTKTDHEEYLNG